MADAPPLDGTYTFPPPPDDPYEEVPNMAKELISLEGFMGEIIPTYDYGPTEPHGHTNARDSIKSHSPRALVSKSREWLASRKSQHSQQGVIDHPGVSPNVRLPSTSARK